MHHWSTSGIRTSYSLFSKNFILYSVFLDDLLGQVFALFVLTVAAAESAIGLAILVVYFRVRGSIDMKTITLMQS